MRKTPCMLLLALLVLLAGCAATATLPVEPSLPPVRSTMPPSPTPAPTAPPPTPIPVRTQGPLNGLPADPARLAWPPIVVMIPSDSDQYGLSQASVVYEAAAEYRIPRFMAIFEWVDAQKIGPVRSARAYFVDWACPYGPLFVHWGGSPQALQLLAGLDCVHPLDGLTYGSAYFRYEEDPQVPWNSEFTTSDLLYGYMRNWEITRTVDYQGYQHKEESLPESRPVSGTIAIAQAFAFPVRYTYDPGSNSYLREFKGRPHLDLLTGDQLHVKNVVILFTPHGPIPDDPQGRIDIQTLGEGEAWVFQDGRAVKGRWVKEAPQAELRFFDEAGQEVAFNRGNIWIEVLAPGTEVQVRPAP
jgi:hypothetical protein